MKFCSLVLELHLPQNFCHRHTDTHPHRQTDRHFPKIVKSCKSIKNRKSKICTKPVLSSSYIEENKNTCSLFLKKLSHEAKIDAFPAS